MAGCDPKALDALTQRELSPEGAAELEAHALTCAECERELSWLRVERALFARRAADAPAMDARAWEALEARLDAARGPAAPRPAPSPAPAPVVSPYRTAAPPPRPLPPRRVSGRLVALLAACGLVLLGGVATLALRGSRRAARFAPRAAGPLRASETSVPARGPVVLDLVATHTDVTVEPSLSSRVSVVVVDGRGAADLVELGASRFEVRLGAGSVAALRVEVPPGSTVRVSTHSGDINVGEVDGDVVLRALSGEVAVRRARAATVATTSGDVRLDAVSGGARVRTSSGDIRVVASSAEGAAAARLDVETASGDLEWSGRCAAGCALNVRTISGDVVLRTRAGSGYALTYATRSGEFVDEVGGGTVAQAAERGAVGRVGSGEGLVNCWTTSGDLTLTP